MPLLESIPKKPSRLSDRFPFPSSAGRATTSAALSVPPRTLSGGIQATGNYPGKARTTGELRSDLETAISLIPGSHRVNLHACYAELDGKKIERNAYTIDPFPPGSSGHSTRNLGIDFNPTYFSHPLSADGFTLSHRD